MAASQKKTATEQITARQVAVVVGAYAFMTIAYYLTIVYNGQAWVKEGQSPWSIESFPRILIDYALKLLITIPIWALFFRWLPPKPVWKRFIAHLVALPVFVFGWQTLYYFICEKLGYDI